MSFSAHLPAILDAASVALPPEPNPEVDAAHGVGDLGVDGVLLVGELEDRTLSHDILSFGM